MVWLGHTEGTVYLHHGVSFVIAGFNLISPLDFHAARLQ